MSRVLIDDCIEAEVEKDDDGSVRFVKDPIIAYMKEALSLTPSKVHALADSGMITHHRLMEYYVQIGYTVSGFQDIFEVKVETLDDYEGQIPPDQVMNNIAEDMWVSKEDAIRCIKWLKDELDRKHRQVCVILDRTMQHAVYMLGMRGSFLAESSVDSEKGDDSSSLPKDEVFK